MPMAKERPMKSSRERVLYLELSAKSHEVGAFISDLETPWPRAYTEMASRSIGFLAGIAHQVV
jgi:hypothetical protein